MSLDIYVPLARFSFSFFRLYCKHQIHHRFSLLTSPMFLLQKDPPVLFAIASILATVLVLIFGNFKPKMVSRHQS